MKKLVYMDKNNYSFDGIEYTNVSDLSENDLLTKFEVQFVVIKEAERTYNCF